MIVITALVALITKRKKQLKIWGSVFIAAGLVVLFFTYSRSAWLGLGISLAALFYWLFTSDSLRRRLIIIVTLVLVVFGFLVLALRHNNIFENTFFHTDNSSRSPESSNQAHDQALIGGLKSIWHEPFGRGSGTAGPASFRNTKGQPRIAENYYVQIGQEVGVIGLAIFIAINIIVVKYLWLDRRQTLSLVLLASFVGLVAVNVLSHAWADDTLSYVWWGLAGIALAPVILDTKQEHNGKNPKATEARS
jgi:O-antigen ligase